MKKILIVDSEPMLISLLTEVVKMSFPEIEPISASNGAEAVLLFRENRHDIVLIIVANDMITENHTQKMKGVALVELIKKTDSKIPIILAIRGDERLENHGADALLSERYPPIPELVEVMRSFLSAKPPAPL